MTGNHIYIADLIIFQIALPHFLFNAHLYNLIQLLGEMDASAAISRRNYADNSLLGWTGCGRWLWYWASGNHASLFTYLCVVPSYTESTIFYVTCFGQHDIRRHRHLKSVCIWDLPFWNACEEVCASLLMTNSQPTATTKGQTRWIRPP